MNAMQLAMIRAIPADTRFPNGGVSAAPVSRPTKQVLIPVRMVNGRKVKAKQITRRIKHVNMNGTVVDECGELWKVRKLDGSSNLYEARA